MKEHIKHHIFYASDNGDSNVLGNNLLQIHSFIRNITNSGIKIVVVNVSVNAKNFNTLKRTNAFPFTFAELYANTVAQYYDSVHYVFIFGFDKVLTTDEFKRHILSCKNSSIMMSKYIIPEIVDEYNTVDNIFVFIDETKYISPLHIPERSLSYEKFIKFQKNIIKMIEMHADNILANYDKCFIYNGVKNINKLDTTINVVSKLLSIGKCCGYREPIPELFGILKLLNTKYIYRDGLVCKQNILVCNLELDNKLINLYRFPIFILPIIIGQLNAYTFMHKYILTNINFTNLSVSRSDINPYFDHLFI